MLDARYSMLSVSPLAQGEDQGEGNLGLALVTRHMSLRNPRFKQTIAIDDYVLDVLMRDLTGHDQQPAAYLVYLSLYGQAARKRWKPVVASLRMLADATGLSKSAVQIALATLRRRELIVTTRNHATATSRHRVLRHWRTG
jgi:DNA-binding MarR family transcriptional regulator